MRQALLLPALIGLAACAPSASERVGPERIAAFEAACAAGPGYAPQACACLADRAAARVSAGEYELLITSLEGASIREAGRALGLDRARIGELSRFVFDSLPACAGDAADP